MLAKRIATLSFLAVLALGCAKASVDAKDTAGALLPKPPVLLVYDFAVELKDVDVDSWGVNAVSGSNADSARRNEAAHTITRKFSEVLAVELTKRGVTARRSVATTPVPMYAIQLHGVFLAIDEGDEAMRTVVGFGKGASRVEARLRAYQKTGSGNEMIGTATLSAQGSKKPGMAASGASAVVTGGVTGLVFSGAMKVADKTGADEPLPNEVKEGIQADVVRAARKVADLLMEKYRQHGWI